jgi:tetratricopeptide (TPR) repeat protein
MFPQKIKMYKPVFYLLMVCFVFLSSYCSGVSPEDGKSLREAYSLFEQGRFIESETMCKQILDRDNTVFQAYNILGAIYESREGSTLIAIMQYKNSIAINKQQINLYDRIASLYYTAGDIDNAILYYKEGLQNFPEDFMLNRKLGFLYFTNKQDPFEAIKYLTVALNVQQQDAELLYMIGLANLWSGNKPQVLEYITTLREIKNQDFAARLEDLMRRSEKGEDVKPELKEEMKVQVPAGASNIQKTSSLQSQGGEVQAQGSGELTIKTKFKKKEKTEGDSSVKK